MNRLHAAFAVLLVSVGLLGCGGSDDSSTSTSGSSDTASTPTTAASPTGEKDTTVPVGEELPLLDDQIGDPHVRFAASPDGSFAYNVSEASASPGKVTIEFVNPTKTVHNVAVEDENGKTIAETKKIGYGRTSTKAVLTGDKYTVYCSVPGHRKAGMVGHITVFRNN